MAGSLPPPWAAAPPPALGALADRVAGFLAEAARWLEGQVDSAWAWLGRRPGYPLDESGAAFLLVGGVATLGLMALFTAVQAAVARPAAPDPDGPRPRVHTSPRVGAAAEAPTPTYRAHPVDDFQRGRAAGTAATAGKPDLDGVLDGVLRDGLGDPRVLRRRGGAMLLRLFGCRGCRRGPDRAGCPFECGFLEGALAGPVGRQVSVREVRCGSGRDGACDFEVWE